MKEYKIKDYIEERNRKEKIASSIIKRRNIVYTPIDPQQQIAAQDEPKEQDGNRSDHAARILQELNDNSPANQALKRMASGPEPLSPEEINELLKER